jgi:hypothetical protein
MAQVTLASLFFTALHSMESSVKQFVSLTAQIIATPAAALIISIDYSTYFFSEPYLSIEVAIERVGSDSDGWGKFNKKIIGSRVGFGSTWSGSGRIFGWTLLDFSGFGSFWVGPGQILGS